MGKQVSIDFDRISYRFLYKISLVTDEWLYVSIHRKSWITVCVVGIYALSWTGSMWSIITCMFVEMMNNSSLNRFVYDARCIRLWLCYEWHRFLANQKLFSQDKKNIDSILELCTRRFHDIISVCTMRVKWLFGSQKYRNNENTTKNVKLVKISPFFY